MKKQCNCICCKCKNKRCDMLPQHKGKPRGRSFENGHTFGFKKKPSLIDILRQLKLVAQKQLDGLSSYEEFNRFEEKETEIDNEIERLQRRMKISANEMTAILCCAEKIVKDYDNFGHLTEWLQRSKPGVDKSLNYFNDDGSMLVREAIDATK
jgi:hypothetical protein